MKSRIGSAPHSKNVAGLEMHPLSLYLLLESGKRWLPLIPVVWVVWRSLAFFGAGYFLRIGGVVFSFLGYLFVLEWRKLDAQRKWKQDQDSKRLDVSAAIAAADRASCTTPGSDWPE